MSHTAFRRILALCAACLCAGAVQASPITFNFTFSGANLIPPPPPPTSPSPLYPKAPKAPSANTALITGSITFESTLLVNPGNNDFLLPNAAVLALNVTVSGASAGNGTYGLSDFGEVRFETNGGTLDFGKSLIGQATSGSPLGTPDGAGGDFNLFGVGTAPNVTAPFGEWFFTACTNGGVEGSGVSDCTNLISMINAAVASPTPTLNRWSLTLLAGLLALAGFVGLRRYRNSH
ncbi:MAG: IPTL-CTERM sorting domain-containing protein [Rudaea sp.]